MSSDTPQDEASSSASAPSMADPRHSEGSAPFAPSSIQRFVIEPSEVHLGEHALVVTARCRLDHQAFAERFTWGISGRQHYRLTEPERSTHLTQLANLLGLCASTSYYKAAAPPQVHLARPTTVAERDVARQLFDEGLREFAVTNGHPVPRTVMHSDGGERPGRRPTGEAEPPGSTAPSLVPIGGGKDSALSASLLTDPLPMSVNPAPSMRRTAAAVGAGLIGVERRLDPALFELNASGALNGHIPITAITSAAACITALVEGAGDVVMSIERSSSEPTRIVDGVEVNHQHSKSLRFEEALSAAVQEATGGTVRYWSALRGLSELAITGLLARRPHMLDGFISCNKAFTVGTDRIDSWCLDCPKCRSTSVLLAPWVAPEQLEGIVGGQILADESQIDRVRALIEPELKPFECVAELEETALALALLGRDRRWNRLPVVEALTSLAADRVGDLEAAIRRALDFGPHRIPDAALADRISAELAVLRSSLS